MSSEISLGSNLDILENDDLKNNKIKKTQLNGK